MMILNKEWMYIHIPKTSGSNFKTTVCKSYKKPFVQYGSDLGDNNINIPKASELYWGNINQSLLHELNIPIDVRNTVHSMTMHCSVAMWEEAEVYNNEKVFTIVRNPYTRLVSLFNVYQKVINRYVEFSRVPTLEDFIFHPLYRKGFSIYGFSTPERNQIDFLKNRDGNIICDRFYKMETQQKKLQRDFRLDNIDTWRYNTHVYNKDYSTIYNDRLIEFVQTTFKQDFEYFNYDINPFW